MNLNDEPQNQPLRVLHAQAGEIFAQALRQASIPAAFDRRLDFENGALMRRRAGGDEQISLPLSNYRNIYVVAAGKAALPMTDALLDRLASRVLRRLPLRGICCAPTLPEHPQQGIRYYAGGHPSPNRDSFRSARAALRLVDRANKDDFVFFLISGGGSSLFEAPLHPRTTLADTIAFHRALVGCGATIAEINAIRKHFSAVKGGRLAAAAGEAANVSLLVSDVPSNQLDALASGPTLPDRSTVAECRAILDRYRLLDQFPPRVRRLFSAPDLPETPELTHSFFDVLLSNDDLLEAAREHAESLGWTVFIDNACDDWDYREAARYLVERLHRLRKEHRRVCLLSGGEVTVRLEGAPGAGGRNQQFVLACAMILAGQSAILTSRIEQSSDQHSGARQSLSDFDEEDREAHIAILSAGSDGVDGLSPAAGAIADRGTITRARANGLDAEAALRGFDSYPLFAALGDTVITGPTKNNLRDLRILLSS